MSDVKISQELRPCYVVNSKCDVQLKALFHGWIYNASNERNPYGIVEYDDGTVCTVPSKFIIFADHKVDQYLFIPFEEL